MSAHISIAGNLGGSPELKQTKAGDVLQLSVAVNRSDKTKPPMWFRVSMFGKRAQSLAKLNLEKGTKVTVFGQYTHDEYTDKQGEKRFDAKVIASDITLQGKPESGGASRAHAEELAPTEEFNDEDIAF